MSSISAGKFLIFPQSHHCKLSASHTIRGGFLKLILRTEGGVLAAVLADSGSPQWAGQRGVTCVYQLLACATEQQGVTVHMYDFVYLHF